MNKEEAINEFLKGLRIVLNNASAYPKEHPYFAKSVDTFKEKLEALLPLLNPVKIQVSPDALFIDEKFLGKTLLYVDLAAIFHRRKIKGVEFRQGVGREELFGFLAALALPLREFLRGGGIGNILDKNKRPHILIEELDYSQFLLEKGEEAKDIWAYLFKAAVKDEDTAKIRDLAENFGKIVRVFRAKDLYEDKELRENISHFLSYLKGAAKDKFLNCSKDLLRVFLKDPDTSVLQEIDKIKAYFEDLTNQDLTDTLIESISKDEDFNNLSFGLFTRLFEPARNQEVASDLERKLKSSESLKNDPRLRKKVKELFSVSDDSYILPVYRQALDWIYADHQAETQLTFERELLKDNYHFLLLNLLAQEKMADYLAIISERILKEIEASLERREWPYLKAASEILATRLKEGGVVASSLGKLRERLGGLIESRVFDSEGDQELHAFFEAMSQSFLGAAYYLQKVFPERTVNPQVLRLWMRFFPDQMDLFYQELERAKSDIDFLSRMAKAMEGSDSGLSLELLKRIFALSNNIIRLEVLKIMQTLPGMDKEFLLSVLASEDLQLKREALPVLFHNEQGQKAGLEFLLTVPAGFGKRNRILLENLTLLEGLNEEQLKQGRAYLEPLSRKPFFWNKGIREKAMGLLRRLDAG
jgi:hypothetical protein